MRLLQITLAAVDVSKMTSFYDAVFGAELRPAVALEPRYTLGVSPVFGY